MRALTAPITAAFGLAKSIASTWLGGIRAAARGDWEGLGQAMGKNGFDIGSMMVPVKIPKFVRAPKAVSAARSGGRAGAARRPARRADPECPTNSFVGGTAVVMADGSSKPIGEMRVGDQVLATDPVTGETVAKTVVATIVGEGSKDLVQVGVDTDGPDGVDDGVIVATAGHPFWVADLNAWVKATDLRPGQWLRTSAGTWVQVTAVTRWTDQARVHNLTIADLHTYYVVAGTTPVLVHNCRDAAKHSVDNLADSLGDDVFFHYTDEAGHAAIMESGVVKANSKGVSYFTQDMVKSGDANSVLFAGNPRYAGRGSHVIGFRISPDRLRPGVQPNELVHQGSFRFTSGDVIYHGPNPFG